METCAVDERMRFVMAAEQRGEAFALVCRRFGVSRKTGYKWLARYRDAGVEGLRDRSRAPLHHPQAITEAIATGSTGRATTATGRPERNEKSVTHVARLKCYPCRRLLTRL
jgi:transposase